MYVPSAKLKVSKLSSLIETTLKAHYANFNVLARHIDNELLAESRKARNLLMGDPIRFAQIIFTSANFVGDNLLRNSGAGFRVDHTFEVEILFEYFDSETDGNSSTFKFYELLENDSTEGSIGLLTKLRETPSLTFTSSDSSAISEGTTLTSDLGLPENVEVGNVVPVDTAGRERIHVCTFTITVT